MVLLRQGMQHVRNYYYNSEAGILTSNFPRAFISQAYKSSFSKQKQRSKVENKLLAAKKHSEAEKRRRMRINSQYDTLRNILHNITKKDKASVLVETIKQVKELKKKVSKLRGDSHGSSKELKFPCGTDRLYVDTCNEEPGVVKATLSCEDRPGLMTAIAKAVLAARGKVLKAEMVTVGGRNRSVLWVQGLRGNEGLVNLERELKVATLKPTIKMRRFTQELFVF